MKLNTKVELSLLGAVILCSAAGVLAAATSRLVDSFVSEGEAGSGDWSMDEREYANM